MTKNNRKDEIRNMPTFYLEVFGNSDDLEEILAFLNEGYDEGDEECEILLKCYKKSDSSSDMMVFKSSKRINFKDINPERLVAVISENFPSTKAEGSFSEEGLFYQYTSEIGDTEVQTIVDNSY